MIPNRAKIVSIILCVMLAALCLTACVGTPGGAPATEAPTQEAVVLPSDPPQVTAVPEPTAVPDDTPEPVPPELLTSPELPCVVHVGGEYSIRVGKKPDTWGTTYYVTKDGDLWAMGDNSHYQIGDGTADARPSRILVMRGVAAFRAHNTRAFALKTDGTLWAWGIYTPWEGVIEPAGFTQPTMLLTNVKEFDLNFALTNGGELWNIECPDSGMLVPSKVMEGVTGYCAYNGSSAVLAVTEANELYYLTRSDEPTEEGGTLHTWEGDIIAEGAVKAAVGAELYPCVINDEGMLLRLSPGEEGAFVPEELLDGVCDICVDDEIMYAIRYDGSLWMYGQVYGWQMPSENEPVKLLDDVKYVCAHFEMDEDWGEYYNFAIKNDNTLWAWGANWYGELGCAEGTDTSMPVCVAEEVARVYCDGVSTYIIKLDGSLWASGYNGFAGTPAEDIGVGLGLDADDARLGDGTRVTKYGFVRIMDSVVQVCPYIGRVYIDYGAYDSIATFARAFAVKADGSLWGWGYNADGVIVPGGEKYLLSPVMIMEP